MTISKESKDSIKASIDVLKFKRTPIQQQLKDVTAQKQELQNQLDKINNQINDLQNDLTNG